MRKELFILIMFITMFAITTLVANADAVSIDGDCILTIDIQHSLNCRSTYQAYDGSQYFNICIKQDYSECYIPKNTVPFGPWSWPTCG